MFNFNLLNKAEPMEFYLQKPNGEIICDLNGIDDSSASCSMPVNNQYEVEFDVARFIDVYNPDTNQIEKVQTNGYDKIIYGMYLYCPQIGSLKMDYPERNFDGEKEYLHITANSVDSELEDKDLYDTQINTGNTTLSLEYLIDLEGTGEELLNSKGLPYDYISFHCTYADELRKIKDKYVNGDYIDKESITELKRYADLMPRLVDKPIRDDKGKITSVITYMVFTVQDKQITKVTLQNNFNQRVIDLINFYEENWENFDFVTTVFKWANCDWTVGTVDEKYHNKHYPFTIENTNVYSFLTQDVAQYVECIFEFDKYRKKVNIIDPEKLGEESGLIVDKTNFLNSVEVSCDEDKLYTRYHVTNSNGLNIAYVNFGSNLITDLSYFMNACDENGKRIFVSDSLAEKYSLYIKDREVARQPYIDLTRHYNQLIMDINELQNRLPNDDLNKHWGSYSDEELNKYLTQYNNLLNALITMCKNDYPDSVDDNTGLIIESKIENTEYYSDYIAYKKIIEQIEYAIKHGYEYEKIEPEDELMNWKTNWKLYGINELNNKIKVYENTMNVIKENGSVYLDDNGSPVSWSGDFDKSKYNQDDYEIAYGEYEKAFNYSKDATEYRDKLQEEVDKKRAEQKEIQSKRDIITTNVQIEKYHRSELIDNLPECIFENPEKDFSFNKEDIREINLLYFDNSYSNENFAINNIDDVVTMIDIEYDLLKSAQEQLSIDSQPQLTFSASIDNLLCQPEFKDYKFYPGNYLLVQYYDDYYMHLRLSNITFNPRIPSDEVTVEFTNYITSNAKRSDVSHILSLSSGGGKSGRSSGGSGGNGNFGDVDLTISNTMLSKLLNADAFAAKVSDVIVDTLKVKTFNARNVIVGEGDDTTEIDGRRITTGWIMSKDYNGNKATGSVDNTQGSILNIKNGNFNFGGSLKKNGTVTTFGSGNQSMTFDGSNLTFGSGVKLNWNSIEGKPQVDNNGNINLTEEQVKQWATEITNITVTTGFINTLYINADGNGQIGNFYIGQNKLVAKGWDEATKTNTDEIVALTRHVVNGSDSVNTYVIAAGTPSANGSYAGCAFRVRHDGKMYAKDADISGSINVHMEKEKAEQYIQTMWEDSNGNKVLDYSNTYKYPVLSLNSNYQTDELDGLVTYEYAGIDITKNKLVFHADEKIIFENTAFIPSANQAKNSYVEAIGTYSNSENKILGIGVDNENYLFWLPNNTQIKLSRGASDKRLKNNISSTRVNALQEINKINMYSFNWKSSDKYQDIGFIADELYEQNKNLVLCDEDNPDSIKSVNTFYLQGLEVKAIQELSAENKKLKQENQELKNRLIAVEAFLTQFGFEPYQDEQ